MSDDENRRFPGISITKDEQGNTVIRDQAYQRYLDSTAPNPSQKTLDAQLARVTRVRVLQGEVIDGKALGQNILLETTGNSSIAALQKCLRISEDPSTFGHCMCHGDHAIELFDGQTLLTVLGLHHGVSIRWDQWKHDGVLLDGAGLVNWLHEHGVTAPKLAFEEDRRREMAALRAQEVWIEAMPKSIAALWPHLDAGNMFDLVNDGPKSTQTTQKLYQCGIALQSELPEKNERILALLRWFGSGAWITGAIPVYEAFPAALLQMIPPKDIISGAQSRPISAIEARGFLRILGDSGFRTEHPCAHLLIPQTFKESLLNRDDLDKEAAEFAKNLFSGKYDAFFSAPGLKVIVQHYMKNAKTPGDKIRANVTASIVQNGMLNRDWKKMRCDFKSEIDLDYLEKEIQHWKNQLEDIVKSNREKYSSL
ncbi:MAG TPA: hypothetical protein PKZ32_04425 [Candidatus Melainabacteria bacterium]|nr:hypothetical protein [Candidatus Melainabacteria bacterium]